MKNLPPVVPQKEWESALMELRAKEKQATRARDALAAERRRLPMVRIESDYVFEGPGGRVSLVDLFEGRSQLILYHFMFGPNQEVGCDGCSMVVDQVGHLAHLRARDVSFVVVSRAPIAKIEAYRKRMGWTIPWVSSFGSDFNHALGVGPESPQPEKYQDGESFGLSVFLRAGGKIYRTYFTTGRGVEALGSVWTFLDLTPFGRQEEWEDSPEGYPQTPPYTWWRRHDEYGPTESSSPTRTVNDTQPSGGTTDYEAQIRRRLEDWAKVFRAKDLQGVMSHYAPDLLAFDVAPPLQHRRDAVRAGLAEWFGTWDGSIGYEIRDLDVSAGGGVAFSHSLNRLTGKRTSGETTDVWMRATVCFRKIGGEWMVVHEHSSVPFYMDGSYRAAIDLKP